MYNKGTKKTVGSCKIKKKKGEMFIYSKREESGHDHNKIKAR